ncbi:TIM barrel protein [Gemmatimonas sp.]|jgi:hydroxypyruvate isomerase|uniref:hydroxypyruvate isomerase family protein n=1 Tax=Gemmatimonas sp. TaxID=1962908 RepID=UPI003340D4AC
MDRRTFLASAGSVAAAAQLARGSTVAAAMPGAAVEGIVSSNRGPTYGHSVCRWCYGGFELKDLCARVKAMGYGSVELLSESEWSVVHDAGLACAVANGPTSIVEGMNRRETHDRILKEAERLLPLVAKAGIPQMIVFSGNRRGMPDDEGLANCADCLRRIMPAAKAEGVTIVMELLNSKVDHRDYMCDRTPWGVRLAEAVGDDRFRLLYDIYHMQVMEGDVIRTIRDHSKWIGHYHTGGVPGRNEIGMTQELFYPAICAAIAGTGYTGFIGQEFIPALDPMESLRSAITLCRDPRAG